MNNSLPASASVRHDGGDGRIKKFFSNIAGDRQSAHCAGNGASDRDQLRQAISRTRSGKGTRLYDAVDLIVTERLNRIEGRKAIVLFTDGIDTVSSGITGRGSIELIE